jgi:hypothetical protein
VAMNVAKTTSVLVTMTMSVMSMSAIHGSLSGLIGLFCVGAI